MTLTIHAIITPEAKLPLKIIKGNSAARNNKSKLYYKKFYSELNHKCNRKDYKIEDIENALNNTLFPQKINYQIQKTQTNNNYIGSLGLDIKFAQKGNSELYVKYLGYKISLPLKQNIAKNKYTVFHEVSHFFDHICNPKFNILRCEKVLNSKNKNIYNDNINLYNFFFEDLNKPISKKHLKKDANELVQKVPRPIAIDSLQKIRYILISEINAYNNELVSLLKDGQIMKYLKLKTFLLLNCKFKTKLAFANKTLKDLIRQERQELKNHCNLNQQV